MSNRPETTKMLSLSVEKHINPYNDTRIYWAREVTFDYSTSKGKRVDYMLFKPKNNTPSGIEKGDFYCYEVKSSVEDFHSKNGHNFLGDFNYYVMPEDGLNHKGTCYDLKCIRKARRKNRDRSVQEMLLMMFRSAARDRRKDNGILQMV